MTLGLFCETFEIPHPPVDLSILLILEDGIRAAWKLLHEYPPASLRLATDVEETINFHLHEALEDHIWNRGVVSGFDEYIFRAIVSAPEVCNYNHKELKKRPDMLAKLTGRPDTVKPSQDGIFIECKPIDVNHALTTQYCNRGITRFVVGRYAWAMQEALMIGYTLRKHDIATDLADAFAKRTTTVLSLGTTDRCHIEKETIVTHHKRAFRYNHNGKEPPAITLRHVWLSRL